MIQLLITERQYQEFNNVSLFMCDSTRQTKRSRPALFALKTGVTKLGSGLASCLTRIFVQLWLHGLSFGL
jgi:hypothetical protein